MSKSRTITEVERPHDPIHPGEALREDFLKPLGMSANRLAKALCVHPNRISEIVRGRRDVTADTALRLERYVGASAEMWLNLQNLYDLDLAKQKSAKEIERAIQPRAA